MLYKGREIKDRIKEYRYSVIDTYSNNTNEFDEDDLQKFIDAIKSKKEELKSLYPNDSCYEDVTISITADGHHYNSYGPDDEAHMEISISWTILESDEHRDTRIIREMEDIDEFIKKEKEFDEYNKIAKQNEIANAMRIIEENGGKVTFNNKKNRTGRKK